MTRLEVGPAGAAASFVGEAPAARPPLEARGGRLVLKRASGDAAGMVEAAWALLDLLAPRRAVREAA